MISFKYNKKINERCWKRIVAAKEMFGHKFPNDFNITQKDVEKAKKQAKYFQKIWENNKNHFYKGIKYIYKHSFPQKMVCYINTSPYSMDDFEKKCISVSMYRDTPEKIISTITHEASHFMFRKYYTYFCQRIGCSQDDTEQIKEIITVINNVEFKDINDYGWKIHQKLRKGAKKLWQESHNIKKVIQEVKNNIA